MKQTEQTQIKLPMVEIFQTIEGEGTKTGFPTTFIRTYNCNIRCVWCDTKYSYAPHPPEFFATIDEIVKQAVDFKNPSICLTGGEPLMHGEKSAALIKALAERPEIEDVHIETNGAIDLVPFSVLRENMEDIKRKVRFIMDVKLHSSGEQAAMVWSNFSLLSIDDEIKFVVGSKQEFEEACAIIDRYYIQGQLLFSPVWDVLAPATLVEWILASPYKRAKLSLQTHKYIWHPEQKGV